MQKNHHRVIILGSGPAGCTACIYTSRANLSPVLITGNMKGGQLTSTSNVDNWPGDPGVQGTDLMEKFLKHTELFDSRIISDHISKVYLKEKPIFLIGELEKYTCDALIIATGASPKYLNIKSEKKFIKKGISVCATCDGFFYKNKNVAVIGGGNTAVEEALFLSKIAKKVTMIHRSNKFRAEPILLDSLFNKNKNGIIEIKWNSVVQEIIGDDIGISSIQIKNIKNNIVENIMVQGVFVAIGHKPNTDIFQGQIEMKNEYIITNGISEIGKSTATNIPGVFAAGDVQDQIYRQAITSAATGCMAAMDVQWYLENCK